MEVVACAFTGHRPKRLPWKDDKTADGCLRQKEVLTAQITDLVDSGPPDS